MFIPSANCSDILTNILGMFAAHSSPKNRKSMTATYFLRVSREGAIFQADYVNGFHRLERHIGVNEINNYLNNRENN